MKKLIRNLALVAVATTALAASAFAQNPALEKRVDLHLKGADMMAAVRLLSANTGLKFVVEPAENGYNRIDLSLEDVSAADAIRYLTQAAGAFAEPDENGVFIIRPLSARAARVAPVANVPAKTIVRLIPLRSADPRDVLDLIRTGDAFNPNRMLDEIRDFGRQYQRLEGGYAQALQQTQNGLTNRATSQPLLAPDDTLALPGDAAGQGRSGGGGGGGGQGGLGGGGGANQGGGGGTTGGGGAGGTGGGDFGGLSGGTGLVPTGTTRLGYDPTDNSIIFQGTDEAYQQLLDLIEQFDRAPRQVIIEVEFVTTSNSNERSLGIDWLYERGTVFAGNRPGTFARASDPIFINWASGNVTTRLRTIMTDGFGRTVSKPVIRTMNNQLAAVQAQTQTTVFLTTTSVSNGTVIQSVNPQTLNISTQLVVRPRINNDGTITVGLNPQIQDFGQLRRSADGQEIPDVLSQVISVVARVKDGETIALGGLTRKQDTFSTSRIPLLSDLPIVGQLFRGRAQQQTSSELLVFVTPTIVKDDSGMAP